MQLSRVKRSKKDVKRAYDRLSLIYDLVSGSSETPLMRLGLEMLAVKRGQTVLEIGSGTGKALGELCGQVGSMGQVHAVDISRGMLRNAHSRMIRTGQMDQVHLVEGDGALLPYKDECFNAVFLSFTLELFDTPEIPSTLAECRRVLQTDGRLGVVSMAKTERPGLPVRIYEWFHTHLPAYADCRPINAGELLQEAGFKLEQRITRGMWGLPVEITAARKL